MLDTVYLVHHHKGVYDEILGEGYSRNSERIVKCFSSLQAAEAYCNQFPYIYEETDEYTVWDYYDIFLIEVE